MTDRSHDIPPHCRRTAPAAYFATLLAAALACAWPLGAESYASAADLQAFDSEQEAIEAGSEALNQFWDYPWYDARNDSVRRINVRPPQRSTTTTTTGGGNTTFGNSLDFSWLKWLAWLGLAALLAALAYLLARAYLDRETRGVASSEDGPAEPLPGEIDRVESLPFQVAAPKTDLLSEARRHFEAGNYNQSIIYLYSYQLIQLDRAAAIHLQKGKTNRQYLMELGPGTPLGRILGRTMIAFEDAFFGERVLDRSRFEACWQELDAFHRELQPVPV